MNATAGFFPESSDSVAAAAGRNRPAPLPAIRRLFAARRPLTARQLLHAIRRCHSTRELADRSDRELRESLNHIRATRNPADPESGLVEIFAITDESIRRRLGYWRIFDPAFDWPGREKHCQPAPDCQFDPAAAALTADEQLIMATLRRTPGELARRYPWDILLPAEFYQALARRDTHSRLQFQPTDEQILAGIYLCRGKIVEMNAGEGKTVAAAFPAVFSAAAGRAVHIATANDYLAARDCELLAPVYRSLGLSVDNVLTSMVDAERRYAYEQPIVYAPLREFGFDWLRDNLKTDPAEQVQGGRDTLIIDEVDQALIDEARTPLIIAGAPRLNRQTLDRANQAVAELTQRQAALAGEYLARLEKESPGSKPYARLLGMALLAQPDNARLRQRAAAQPHAYRQALAVLYPDGSDYPDPALAADLYCLVDPEQRFVTLTARGLAFLENRLAHFYDVGADHAAGPLSRQDVRRVNLANQVYQLLRAYLLLKRDGDYIVAEDGIILLDRVTGRPRPDSRYQEGLHPALEAKEGVAVHPDGPALAQISVQGLAQQYRHLSGMTGTAADAAAEFQQLYCREVVVLPAARPLRRQDWSSRVYNCQEEQLAAIADTVRQCQSIGQPVLVGVQTVAQSALVSRHLSEQGIDHRLLNAITSAAEAEILRQAGAAGAVTVATNMAGRGADIILDPALNQRLIANVVSLIRQRLNDENRPIAVHCPSAAADLLAAALAADSELTYARRDRNRAEFAELIVSRADSPPSNPEISSESLEFGLGLYVLSAAFSPAARIAWQLKGRSGRQGQFGATRFILSWDDPLLAYQGHRRPDFARCQKTDAAGRIYFESKAVERYLYRLQETAETDAAARRSIQQDYAAIADAHTAAYYQARQQLMTAADGAAAARALIPAAAARLAARHFPAGDTADYPRRFSRLAKELQEWYGIEAAPEYGLALDELPAAIADLLSNRLTARQAALGIPRFAELARLLRLQSGDELWKDYQGGLQALSVSSRLGGYGPKSAVADYIIHAAAAWRQFQAEGADLFLARLCAFPLADLAMETAPALELDERAAALLLG